MAGMQCAGADIPANLGLAWLGLAAASLSVSLLVFGHFDILIYIYITTYPKGKGLRSPIPYLTFVEREFEARGLFIFL